MRFAHLALLFVTLVPACAGDAPPVTGDDVTFVDTDGDGKADGVDSDGDGKPDFGLPAGCTTCTPGGHPVCTNPLVDTDGDGIPDGLDFDCDGHIDVPLDIDPGSTGGTNECFVDITQNGVEHTISCSGATCECKLNGQLVRTCSDTGSHCDVPGNCCGF